LHNPRRLSPADAHLLDLEDRRGVHMHVGCVLVFEGVPPGLAEFTEHIRSRLDLVPRYRRSPVAVPLRQGRPIWVDDPHLALEYHVRDVALAGSADDPALTRLAGDLFSRRIDHGKPLWEMWLVERLAGGRFAIIAKSHHALVDGVANRDLVAVLLDGEPDQPLRQRPPAATAQPGPGRRQLLLETLAERVRDPREAVATLRALAARTREELEWRDLDPLARAGAPPPSRLNVPVGAHRRFGWLEISLARVRKAKERLGGTVNDAVLTAVAGAVGRYLRIHGEDTEGLVLRALVPLADAVPGRVLATYAPLPVGIEDPRRRHAEISRALDGLRTSGRARAAEALVERDGFAPATILSQAARLQARQRAFNLAVTNVPGPQSPRYLLGRPLRAVYPAMPLARNQTLSVALVSYAGRLCFGLLGDYDALGDLELLTRLLEESLAELQKGGKAKGARAALTH
jgi:diacylglycerol O-acyltransferase / wax synthase